MAKSCFSMAYASCHYGCPGYSLWLSALSWLEFLLLKASFQIYSCQCPRHSREDCHEYMGYFVGAGTPPGLIISAVFDTSFCKCSSFFKSFVNFPSAVLEDQRIYCGHCGPFGYWVLFANTNLLGKALDVSICLLLLINLSSDSFTTL